MKVIAFNASPRKSGNTATILEAVLEGARNVGAETELVHLADLDMKGCQGCRHCDLNPGHCIYEDGFTPYMGKILESDVIIVGTPVYIFRESSLCKALIERFFCYVKVEIDLEMGTHNTASLFPPGKRFGFIITQGFPNADIHKDIIDYLKLAGSFISGRECEALHYVGAHGSNSATNDSDLLERARMFGEKIALSL